MTLRWRLRELLERFGPAALLLGTGLVATVLVFTNPRGGLIGFAAIDPVSVGPLEPLRVAAVHVAEGDGVTAGQLLATLDGSALKAELAVLRAEQELARARQSGAEVAALESADALQTEWLEAQAAAQAAASEAKALRAERKRQQDMVAAGNATTERLSEIDIRLAAVEAEASGRREAVSLLRARMERARQSLTGEDPVATGEPVRSLEVIARRIGQVEQALSELELRAPVAGRVGHILARAGAVASDELPVLQLLPEDGRQVVVCLSEKEAAGVSSGDHARLHPREGGATLTGTVRAVSAHVELYAPRCRTLATYGTWGRVAYVEVSTPLLAGQLFDVTLRRPWGAKVSEPQPITVPEGVAAKSAFEPSGLAWLPDQGVYLVVSDDTGHSGQPSRRKPWLFAMNEDGEVLPDILELGGLDEVDDLEGVARRPDGQVYLLSSQSVSAKGKRRTSRTGLHRVDADLQAQASVSLFEALVQLEPEQLDALGLGAGRLEALDIEGLAFHDGDLYLGLKAPLDDSGRAMVWRLDQPDAFMDRGILEPGQLATWMRVPLDASADGSSLPGGISDLAFLPDGALAVTTTPSAADDDTATGVLYRVRPGAAGIAQARRVRVFEGLKPEGISLSGRADHLAVVFDTDAATPRWLELPWQL